MATFAEQIANDFNECFEQLPPEKQQEVIEWFDARSSTTDHNGNIQSRVMRWIVGQMSISAVMLEYAALSERIEHARK